MKRTILAAVAAGLAMALFAQNAETPTKQKIKVCVFQPPYALNAADIDSSMQWEFDHLKLCDGGKPDLVLFGKQAIDGDTAQVGPGVSEFLDVPLITYVRSLKMDAEGNFEVESIMDDGANVIQGKLPAVMTVLKEASVPRFASLSGWMAAKRAQVAVYDEKTVNADPDKIGLKGSPTKVVTIFPPPTKTGGKKIDCRSDKQMAVDAIMKLLKEKGIA